MLQSFMHVKLPYALVKLSSEHTDEFASGGTLGKSAVTEHNLVYEKSLSTRVSHDVQEYLYSHMSCLHLETELQASI